MIEEILAKKKKRSTSMIEIKQVYNIILNIEWVTMSYYYGGGWYNGKNNDNNYYYVTNHVIMKDEVHIHNINYNCDGI